MIVLLLSISICVAWLCLFGWMANVMHETFVLASEIDRKLVFLMQQRHSETFGRWISTDTRDSDMSGDSTHVRQQSSVAST